MDSESSWKKKHFTIGEHMPYLITALSISNASCNKWIKFFSPKAVIVVVDQGEMGMKAASTE